jgi:enterochelin esterase-like enzyme
LIILLLACNSAVNEIPNVSSGSIERISNLSSKFVDIRNIDIWLPKGYSTEKKYAVVYMHDGQMLFDSTKTWNKQEWRVDETLTSLFESECIEECIVVGIWNNGNYRHTEYFPQRIIDEIPQEFRESLIDNSLKGRPQADNYLKFIVEELKPCIDIKYSTLPDMENTFIMGSSMGGIISIYAICEYPKVFGGAACLSTHWPLIISKEVEAGKIVSHLFQDYLKLNLPKPEEKKIYFDYGSETLDSLYKPYQAIVDEIMENRGYNEKSWMTKEFTGDDHSERSWSRRLEVPFQFILNK